MFVSVKRLKRGQGCSRPFFAQTPRGHALSKRGGCYCVSTLSTFLNVDAVDAVDGVDRVDRVDGRRKDAPRKNTRVFPALETAREMLVS